MTDRDQPALDGQTADQIQPPEYAVEVLPLRLLPERLGLVESAELETARESVTAWLSANREAATEAFFLGQEQEQIRDYETPLTTGQAAMQAAWRPYVDLAYAQIDAALVNSTRVRLQLAMFVDQAIAFFDGGCTEIYLDRIHGTTGFAIQQGLIVEAPELRPIAERTGQPIDV